MDENLIFGKDKTERVVCIEQLDSSAYVYTEALDGTVVLQILPSKRFILAASAPRNDSSWKRLDGDLHYKYGKKFSSDEDFQTGLNSVRKSDYYTAWDTKEAFMLTEGFTYHKGCKLKEISILSFDIETTSITHSAESMILLISNTFRRGDHLERKLFSYDDYDSQGELLEAWCSWVRDVNPSVLTGHNIYMYDLPYMAYCAQQNDVELVLGRDTTPIRFDTKTSKFRRDGSQFYEYTKAHIFGREIIDTFFLSIKYDVGRKYETYGLKSIIKAEGLEVKDRVFYDASKIRFNYKNPVEFEKIKAYCVHDSDDSLALYDLMVSSYFYLSQSVPKSFSSIINSAPGSQINSFLVRSYLQQGHSLPKSNAATEYEGAISIGNPGSYKHCFKVDVSSLYPSIMMQYKVYDPIKDPKQHFLQMVEYFTEERLNNKKRAKETGDSYYKDLEQSQKIIINSAYGMLGATGLLFNSPAKAAFVTLKGREILQQSIDWAQENSFQLVNADTDSVMISDGNEITQDDRKDILNSINSMYPSMIRFEDDGYYKAVLVVKAKNYVLDNGEKLKIKGSALKATYKEKALKEFIEKAVRYLLENDVQSLKSLYNSYVVEIFSLKDVTRWASKKTITDKILNPERTNESKVLDAIKDLNVSMGDKIYCYFALDGSIKTQEAWTNDHDPKKLLEKLYKTLEIFESVLNIDEFPNFKLKRNGLLLQSLLG